MWKPILSLFLVIILASISTLAVAGQTTCPSCHSINASSMSGGWEDMHTDKPEVAICQQSVDLETSAQATIAGHQGQTIKPHLTSMQMEFQCIGKQITGQSTAVHRVTMATSLMAVPRYLQTAWNSGASATPSIAVHL